MVPQFEGEIRKLFGKSKKDMQEYLVYLASQMKIVEDSKGHPSEYPFEHLKDDHADLYRIKSKSKRKNVRVIYYYQTDDTIVLLCAFEEKSHSDYTNNIEIAKRRIKSLEGK